MMNPAPGQQPTVLNFQMCCFVRQVLSAWFNWFQCVSHIIQRQMSLSETSMRLSWVTDTQPEEASMRSLQIDELGYGLFSYLNPPGQCTYIHILGEVNQ